MSKLIKVEVEGVDVWMEADDDAISHNGPIKARATDITKGAVVSFSELSDQIIALSEGIVKSYEKLNSNVYKPSKITADFGFKINGEGNVYIVKTGCEASIAVSLEWEKK